MLKSNLDLGADFRAEAIVIGGSAGAVGVLGEMLPALPASLKLPIVVVVHLPSGRPSALRELFARRCAMSVREPTDKQPVEPGIWFAPADYHLLIEQDRSFALSIDEPVKFSRPSIDVLFESAASVYGRHLLGIVLTGANDDAALGARAIRDHGGALAVQDPAHAEASAMPKAAIALAMPQIIGTVSELTSAVISASGG